MDPVIFKLVSEYQSAFEPLFISVLKYLVNFLEDFLAITCDDTLMRTKKPTLHKGMATE